MIAIDSSSAVSFLRGESGTDVLKLEEAIRVRQAILPPIVITELLSDPTVGSSAGPLISSLPALGLSAGFWERAGNLRALAISNGFKAKLGDALIAQACLDHDVPLVTRDRDFRHFENLAGLRLIGK